MSSSITCKLSKMQDVLKCSVITWPQSKDELDAVLKSMQLKYNEGLEQKFKEETEKVIGDIRSHIMSVLVEPFKQREHHGYLTLNVPEFDYVHEASVREAINQQNFGSFPAIESFVWSLNEPKDYYNDRTGYIYSINFKFVLKKEYYLQKRPLRKRLMPENTEALKRLRKQLEENPLLDPSRMRPSAEISCVTDYIDQRLRKFVLQHNNEPGSYDYVCHNLPIPLDVTMEDTEYLDQIKQEFTSYDYITSMELEKRCDWHAKFTIIIEGIKNQTSSSSAPLARDSQEGILACITAARAALPPALRYIFFPLSDEAKTESPSTDCCTPPTVDPPADATA